MDRSLHRGMRVFPDLARVLPLAGVVVLGGCGNLVAGGATTGETSVAVSGDAPESTGGMTAAESLTFRSTRFEDSGPSGDARTLERLAPAQEVLEGTVSARFSLFLEAEDGRSIELSNDPIQVEVDIQGIEEREVIRNTVVPATRYVGIRMVFTEVDAEVTGIVPGELPVAIRVALEGPSLTVTRPLDLEITEGGRSDLLIDLNSQTWLATADPITKIVAGESFAEAVTVSGR